MTQEQTLDAFPFLRAVPRESRDGFFLKAVPKHLDHKEVLVRDGNECAYLPFVLKGVLRVYKTSETGRALTLYRIERGESCVLTATCIFNGGGFPAVAEAEGATDVLLTPAVLMVRLVEQYPEWRRYVFGLYARRLDAVLTLVEEVAFHHVDARLAAYLLKASEGARGIVNRTHGEIASELGTSREVVSRILSDFEAEGLIAISRGRIGILQSEELEQKRGISPLV
jgi:CRP/FNR family transcriptional regulator